MLRACIGGRSFCIAQRMRDTSQPSLICSTHPVAIHMKPVVHVLATALFFSCIAGPGVAQSRIYRCGNEYTNNPPSGQQRSCTLVEGGNVTVIEGTRPQPSSPPPSGGSSRVVTAPSASSGAPPRIDNADQRARDNDARGILESELRKAELRHTELVKEYNNGTPERIAGEVGNDLRYQTRIAELKAGIDRVDSDLAGIRRELGRVTPR